MHLSFRVFGLGDMLAPCDGVALLIDLLYREVRHEAVGCGAVPVILCGLEEHTVSSTDDLDRAALALAEPDAFGDIDRLPEGMGMPRRPGTSAPGC